MVDHFTLTTVAAPPPLTHRGESDGLATDVSRETKGGVTPSSITPG